MDYVLEPLQRARSNTWPQPRPDAEDGGPQAPDGSPPQLLDMVNGVCGNGGAGDPSAGAAAGGLPASALHPPQQAGGMVAGPAKKTSSRRNAWGNQSYADLITQAIGSVPEQRLTLSQIYEWMVQNVPYFKDKGDSNSSAGWKVRKRVDYRCNYLYNRLCLLFIKNKKCAGRRLVVVVFNPLPRESAPSPKSRCR